MFFAELFCGCSNDENSQDNQAETHRVGNHSEIYRLVLTKQKVKDCFNLVLKFYRNILWCKNKDFSKERPTIIASKFPIPVDLSYKLESNSAIEIDLKCD